jgi:hypothetical protein
MTQPHGDWPKTLEWVEKQGLESLKARFTTAELIAKEAQTTLTVILAGLGGSAAYAAKIFAPGASGPIEVAAAGVCIYLIALAVFLVLFCMMFQEYPALHQNPENLLHPDHSIDEIREEEVKNIGVRIKEAAAINAKRAAHLNKLRVLTALSPFVFAAIAAMTPPVVQPATDKAKLACKVDSSASVPDSRIEIEFSK